MLEVEMEGEVEGCSVFGGFGSTSHNHKVAIFCCVSNQQRMHNLKVLHTGLPLQHVLLKSYSPKMYLISINESPPF